MVHFLLLGGALSSANLGINALTRGAVRCLAATFEDAQCTVLNLNLGTRAGSAYCGVVDGMPCCEVGSDNRRALLHAATRLVSRGLDARLYQLFEEADAVIDLCEGDGFGDTYGLRVFARYAVYKYLATRQDKPLIVFPQTLGPFDSPLTRVIARYLFRRARYLFVREPASYAMVAKLMGSTAKLGLHSDMAFLMSPEPFPYPLALPADRPLVGVNISGFLYNRAQAPDARWDYVGFMARLVEEFLQQGASVILVPHVLDPQGHEDDGRACQAVLDSTRDVSHVGLLEGPYSAPQVKELIGRCEFFVGARMHACIAALSTGVPVVPLAYSHKAAGILSLFGLDAWVANPATQADEEMLALFRAGYAQRAALRATIAQHLPQVEQSAYQVGQITRDLLRAQS